ALFACFKGAHFDWIVATHEAAALPALVLKWMRLVRAPLVILNVALLHPKNRSGARSWLWRCLLPQSDAIVCYAAGQVDCLADEFRLEPDRMFFMPLGVDTDFFSPANRQNDGTQDSPIASTTDFCLSVGTNEGKDYLTLLNALPPRRRVMVVTDGYNAQVIRCHLDRMPQRLDVQVLQDVPIDVLRELYRHAKVIIIPLNDSYFSSGQTVLLENMAMGNVVIVTNTMATRNYVTPDVTVLAVRAGDVNQLRDRIESVFTHPEQYASLGENAA